MAPPNFANRTLFHGDNLTFLRGMNSGCVDLIPTDPPFKKQRGFFSDAGGFKDTWTWQRDALGLDDAGKPVADNHEEWLANINKDYPAVYAAVESARHTYGDDMGAFLCWMAPRLLEMHRVLKPTGSLYLHCDYTAAAYLKVLLDAIFGMANFRNEIIWRRYGSHNDASRRFGHIHDTILFYSKGDNYTWTDNAREPYDEAYIATAYREQDETGRYATAPLHARQLSGGGYHFEWRGITDVWRFSRERLDEMDAAGLIHWPKRGRIPRRKVYLDETKGIPARDMILDIKPLSRAEHLGYPTQKPLALYERIIQASSNLGDLVLDPFCGCATTCVAAERLGRQWIGMDISPVTEGLIRQRLEDNKQLLTDGVPVITVTPTPPVRTDDGATAASDLVLRAPAVRADWQKLTRAEMVRILGKVQSENGLVICVGCGRALEPEFMQLDHREPKSDGGEDWITNRMLLCQPCNGRKSNRMTLSGLQAANRRNGWMKDADKARLVNSRAIEAGRLVRDQWGSEYVRGLLAE